MAVDKFHSHCSGTLLNIRHPGYLLANFIILIQQRRRADAGGRHSVRPSVPPEGGAGAGIVRTRTGLAANPVITDFTPPREIITRKQAAAGPDAQSHA